MASYSSTKKKTASQTASRDPCRIGQYLYHPALESCARVSRTWRNVFVPVLWRTIEDRWFEKLEYACDRPESYSVPCLLQRRFLALLVKYGCHVRHLTLYNERIVAMLALGSGAYTCLQSLVFSFSDRHPGFLVSVAGEFCRDLLSTTACYGRVHLPKDRKGAVSTRRSRISKPQQSTTTMSPGAQGQTHLCGGGAAKRENADEATSQHQQYYGIHQ